MIHTQAIHYYQQLPQHALGSTCNKRKVAAALVFPDGMAFFGSSGSKQHSCTSRGRDYCTRSESLEYATCPSPCAEGETFIAAVRAGRDLRQSTVISTDLPCERCKNIIIDCGVESLYFGMFKEGEEMRLRDAYYVEQMVLHHDAVIQILPAADGFRFVNYHSSGGNFSKFAMRNNGKLLLQQLLQGSWFDLEAQPVEIAVPGQLSVRPLL